MVEQQGSIDWAGLQLVAGLFGIRDPDALVTRLMAIKTHARKPARER